MRYLQFCFVGLNFTDAYAAVPSGVGVLSIFFPTLNMVFSPAGRPVAPTAAKLASDAANAIGDKTSKFGDVEVAATTVRLVVGYL